MREEGTVVQHVNPFMQGAIHYFILFRIEAFTACSR